MPNTSPSPPTSTSAPLPPSRRSFPAAANSWSRAYLHHLVKAEEMLGPRLVTQHNLHFYASLVREARQAIEEGRYAAFAEETMRAMREGDEIGKGG